MEDNKNIFMDTKPEFYFKTIDGSDIKNLFELANDLERMSDDTYYFHVNGQRNDFSNWIRDIFNEHKLADDISKTGNRLEAEICLLKFIIEKLK